MIFISNADVLYDEIIFKLMLVFHQPTPAGALIIILCLQAKNGFETPRHASAAELEPIKSLAL